MPPAPARENLTRFAWLSIAAAVATIALKFGAYLLTGSVGLLSDAAESVVNLVAAFVALIALHVAAQPADVDHQFGHSKAEYFSAAVEGVMIFVAAIFILWSSVQRFFAPEPLENVGMGLGISVAASALNGVVAFVLMRAGRKHNSITLTADGKHLLTDVWTSVGVVVGVLLVVLTGWLRLDPIIAFLVGGLGGHVQGDEGDEGRHEVDHGFGRVGQQSDRSGQKVSPELQRNRRYGGRDRQPGEAGEVLTSGRRRHTSQSGSAA